MLIVNWNTRDLLRPCLGSLENFPPKGDLEVVVVDNASDDGSAEMVAREFPKTRLISTGRNVGYAAGNNLAFAEAKGEWLLTLNPDTEILDGSLDAALDALSADPKAAALGARLLGPDGVTQRSVRGFPTLLGTLGDFTGLGKLFPRSKWGSYRLPSFDYERQQHAPQPMGTFLMFRRAALETVGDPKRPFDESFPIFFNEVDLLYRLKRAGLYCIYCPDVKIVHHGGASTKQVRKSMVWESHRSLLRFFRKHCLSAWNAPLYPLLAGFVLGAALVRAKGWDAGFRA